MAIDQQIGTDEIRAYLCQEIVQKARGRGERRFTVNAGEVHRALHLHNRVPLVCSALQSGKFLEQNRIRIVEKSGPPSGLSTSVNITYEFIDEIGAVRKENPLLALRGIAREVFAGLGGGESFVRGERAAFGDDKERERP